MTKEEEIQLKELSKQIKLASIKSSLSLNESRIKNFLETYQRLSNEVSLTNKENLEVVLRIEHESKWLVANLSGNFNMAIRECAHLDNSHEVDKEKHNDLQRDA
jgi:hypothetical protein